MSEPLDERLACGAAVGDLVDQVADDAPADRNHQSGCPHCQAALAELRSLWEATRVVAAEQVDAPEHLDTAIMRRVRREKFVRDALRLFAGTLPRLGWALVTYGGLLTRPEEQPR